MRNTLVDQVAEVDDRRRPAILGLVYMGIFKQTSNSCYAQDGLVDKLKADVRHRYNSFTFNAYLYKDDAPNKWQ